MASPVFYVKKDDLSKQVILLYDVKYISWSL